MAEDQVGSTRDREKSFEDEAASLVHDLRTRVMTIRNLSALLGDGATGETRKAIEGQLDRINARLDTFWTAVRAVPEEGDPASSGLRLAHEFRRFKVLFVDDDEVHRDVGERLLGQMGHEVMTCPDGLTAFDHCRETSFDLIFLDEHAPILSGTRFAETWDREMENYPRPYMVGMSNDPRCAMLRERCLEAGMRDYMEKPITRAKLATIMAIAGERILNDSWPD